MQKDPVLALPSLPIRLSIITDELDPELTPALDACQRLGVPGVELRTLGGQSCLALDDAGFAAAMREIAERRLRVTALASPVFKCVLPGTEASVGALHGAKASASLAEHWTMLDQALARAEAHGIPFVRVFSGWRTSDPEAVSADVVVLMREAQRRADGSRVEVVLENEHDCNVATAAETAAVLERVPELRVIWDPGNHIRAGGDPEASACPGFEDRVAHVHVKDVDLSGTWVPVGSGRVPFGAVLDGLLDAGFDGSWSLETHCEIAGSRERASAHSIAALAARTRGER